MSRKNKIVRIKVSSYAGVEFERENGRIHRYEDGGGHRVYNTIAPNSRQWHEQHLGDDECTWQAIEFTRIRLDWQQWEDRPLPDTDPFCMPPLSSGDYDTTEYESQWT